MEISCLPGTRNLTGSVRTRQVMGKVLQYLLQYLRRECIQPGRCRGVCSIALQRRATAHVEFEAIVPSDKQCELIRSKEGSSHTFFKKTLVRVQTQVLKSVETYQGRSLILQHVNLLPTR